MNANEDILIEEQIVENSTKIESINENMENVNINSKEVIYEGEILLTSSVELETQDLRTFSGNIINVTGNTYGDIRDAISLAQPGDTIVLGNKTYTATATDTYIIINKENLTITGSTTENGIDRSIIDGNNLVTMFRVTANGTTIKNIDFKNSFSNARGDSAIRMMNYLNDIKILDCTFNNSVKYDSGDPAGASLFALNIKYLELINCNFTNGYIYSDDDASSGGALFISGSNILISNCLFENNSAVTNTNMDNKGAVGGAFRIAESEDLDDNITIDYCAFINNNAINLNGGYSHGGAVCVGKNLNLTNCIFINNSAEDGGAITTHAGGIIINCTFINNSAYNYGGAISTGFKEDATGLVSIDDCMFINNSAPIAGGVYVNGETLDIIINNSTFMNNIATTDNGIGGAFVANSYSLTITDSDFEGNSAVYGGAGYIQGESTTIINSSFTGNEARVIDQEHNGVDGLGGAIYLMTENNKVVSSHFNHNKARNGSAIYNNGHIEIEDTEFITNQAWSYYLVMSTVDNITYGDTVDIYIVLVGGDNIHHPNPNISNAIYHNNTFDTLFIDGVNPVLGAENSDEGTKLYQDGREPHSIVDVVVIHEETGEVVFNGTVITDYLGAAAIYGLKNGAIPLRIGNYTVYGNHPEDMNYKEINNFTTFKVISGDLIKEPNKDVQDIGDNATWTISFFNNGTKKVNVTITDTYNPEEMKYLGSNVTPFSIKDGIIVWKFTDVEVGETIFIELYTQLLVGGILQNNVSNEYESVVSFVAVMTPTITTVTIPNEIIVGETVEIEATLTDKDGNILKDKEVELFVDGVFIGNFTTNENGIVKTNHKFTQEGEYKIEAKFNGDDLYYASNGTNQTVANKIPTITTVEVPDEVIIGEKVEIEVTLTDEDGNPLENKTLDVIVDGEKIGNVTTDKDGKGYINHTFTEEGKPVITAEFAGDNVYEESTGKNTTNVAKIPTTTTVEVPEKIIPGATEEITITLTDEDGNPLENKTLDVIVDGEKIGNVTTDKDGKGYINHTFTEEGKPVITAEFAGDNVYEESTGKNTTNVAKIPTTTTVTVPDEITVGETIEIEVRLTDEDGNPLENKTLDVTIDGKVIGNVTTDKDGKGYINHTFTEESKPVVEAKFLGDDLYGASEGENNTNVKKIPTITTIIVDGDKIIAIVTDEEGNPLEGVEVTFTIGGKVIGVGTTDANGIATIYYKDAYKETIKATFAGNDKYYGSSDTYNPAVDPVDPTNPTSNDVKNELDIVNASTMQKTGNPVALVLIVLIAISMIGFRKKE
ncbi:Ig-like domain repeat protein [Methanobrevibacter sp. DSM 116169]|uniref:Ig-like domain repeat protein n=1 Tax=Methanobrevibacter sp. DSM 116169 TaxID=3242727 RepID=UPI0038FCB5A3